MSIKALAQAVLLVNRQVNSRETLSLPSPKSSQLKQKVGKPQPSRSNTVQIQPILQWQNDFCLEHADFNNWREACPKSLNDCLISRLLDSSFDYDQLGEVVIGHGITVGDVVKSWVESGEPMQALVSKPLWLICMAEYLVLNNVRENAQQ